MEFKRINLSVSDNIGFIELNSPKNLNAFDEKMVNEVLYALDKFEKDEDVNVIIMSGVGKSFSAGGDIGYFYQELRQNGSIDFKDNLKKIATISLNIKRLSKPVIASVHGAVAGAAFNISLACDFCIATEDAKFIQAFVNIGLVPDAGGTYLLTRAIGVNKTTQLIMTGAPVGAIEAYNLGIVSKVVKSDELESETLKQGKKLVNGPALSYKNMKKLIFESQYKDFESYIELEDKLQKECAASEDFKEGIFSFVQKKKPEFKGR